jgi:hypothetical protein
MCRIRDAQEGRAGLSEIEEGEQRHIHGVTAEQIANRQIIGAQANGGERGDEFR